MWSSWFLLLFDCNAMKPCQCAKKFLWFIVKSAGGLETDLINSEAKKCLDLQNKLITG